MAATQHRVSPDALRAAVRRLLEAIGLDDADATVTADAFVLQEMRGVTTHGLRRLPQLIDDLQDGRLNPRAHRAVVAESASMVVLDGDRGPGIPGCFDAMQRAVAKAKAGGVGMASVRSNGHFLGAAPYCLAAVEQDAVGIAFSNSGASMAYPGTSEPVLGNGPFGYAMPTAAGFPLVYDAAMTTSGGKLLEWQREGVPEGEDFAGFDADGNLTRDPAAVLRNGATLPIGGHKGAGLVMLIEALTGLLAGGQFLHEAIGAERVGLSTQTCIAIDIAHFMPVEDFRERAGALVREVKSHPARDGKEVLLPGERAHRSYTDCAAHGVPMAQDILTGLHGSARDIGVGLAI